MKTSILAYKLVNAEKNHGIQQSVQVLDPIKNSPLSWFLRKGMDLFGISLKEAKFFAGHLRTVDGDSIWVAAANILNNISYEAAKRNVNNSKALFKLNDQWSKNTLILYLSKYYYRIAGYGGDHTVFKIMVSDALSRDRDKEEHHLILGLHNGFTPDLFDGISKKIIISTYSTKEWSIRKTRFSVLFLLIFVSFKRFLKRMANIFQPIKDYGDVNTKALLILQEDDLSMDRSYRGQPHWLFKEDPPPEFRTLTLETDSKLYDEPSDWGELKKYGVYSVPKDILYGYSSKHPIKKKISHALLTFLYMSFIGSRAIVDICFELALLFMKASLLTDFCISQNVKAFMTCENYYLDADAMNLVGPSLNVHTFSYQYSNMSEVGPIMMTTADTMCTFSPLFHERWSNNGIQPKSFINIGYVFDSSFSFVAERAKKLRKQLKNNGSQFIICYFDESVQGNEDKYGNMSIDDHYREISALSKLVIQDSSISVIIKTQFQENTPSIMFEGNKIIESAKATNRFIELFYGKHRNIYFPAEPAIAADLVIGHAIGSTACLEAALNGCRCIVLNPYGMKGSNIELFNRADILYDNMESALSTVSFFRQGKPNYQDLGDWSSILYLFDSFRGRQSAGSFTKSTSYPNSPALYIPERVTGNKLRELLEERILV